MRTQLRAAAPPSLTGFAADARRYLEAAQAMPSYQDRARDIAIWVDLFGDRPRALIAAVEIRAARERWLTVGPRRRQHWVTDPISGKRVRHDELVDEPLAASTVNHRLRALENLYTVLDGRHARNPVREVPEARETERQIRAVPLDVVRTVLAAMSDTATRARLAVLAYTGLPHASLARLQPDHANQKAKTLWVPGRQKGEGTRGRLLPLTRDGVDALKALARHDAWGPFSRGSLRRAWRRACRAVDVPEVRVYDLRHSYGTLALQATGDLRATQLLLGHSTPKLTERYARAAINPALEQAAKAIQRAQRAGTSKTPA